MNDSEQHDLLNIEHTVNNINLKTMFIVLIFQLGNQSNYGYHEFER